MTKAIRTGRFLVKCSCWSGAVALSVLVIAGVFFTAVEATNSLEFCTSCHTMSYNFEELKKSVHYQNKSGVRAICSDCHVPKKSFVAEVGRKFAAVGDLWAELVGTIDTPEKFSARREKMAREEWERMRESDSIGCRNCHSFEAMKLAEQDAMAARKHERAAAKGSGKTCIDCHKGVAHKMPRASEAEAS
jgi:nitrate/TMAO reductase-like tetraheme cytochrome c subunit